jgi:uncharacterized damage-inducible protein DinB
VTPRGLKSKADKMGGTPMTPDQAKVAADMFATLWQEEFPVTCQVLAAVKDDNRDYRPDPKSRTAWQLATHIATADLWFIDCIKNGRFHFDPEQAKKLEAGFSSVDDVVEFYKKTFLRSCARWRRCLPPT